MARGSACCLMRPSLLAVFNLSEQPCQAVRFFGTADGKKGVFEPGFRFPGRGPGQKEIWPTRDLLSRGLFCQRPAVVSNQRLMPSGKLKERRCGNAQ